MKHLLPQGTVAKVRIWHLRLIMFLYQSSLEFYLHREQNACEKGRTIKPRTRREPKGLLQCRAVHTLKNNIQQNSEMNPADARANEDKMLQTCCLVFQMVWLLIKGHFVNFLPEWLTGGFNVLIDNWLNSLKMIGTIMFLGSVHKYFGGGWASWHVEPQKIDPPPFFVVKQLLMWV